MPTRLSFRELYFEGEGARIVNPDAAERIAYTHFLEVERSSGQSREILLAAPQGVVEPCHGPVGNDRVANTFGGAFLHEEQCEVTLLVRVSLELHSGVSIRTS